MSESEISNVSRVTKNIEPERLSHVVLDQSSFSYRVIFRVVIFTLLILLVAGFVQSVVASLTYLFFLIVLAIFFAYLIAPLVRLIRMPFVQTRAERLMSGGLAIIFAYLIVFTILGFVISIVAPQVIEQGKEFGTNFPSYATSLRRTANDLNRRFDRLRISDDVQNRINDQIVSYGQSITAAFGSFVISLVTYMPWLILIPILSFFFLKDVKLFRLSILRIFPAGTWRIRAEAVLQDVNATLAAYTRAQLISCFIIGLVCTAGFYLIGLKYALLLGILAGIFEFIPLLGPLSIGIIVTITAAFSDDPWNALYVMVFLIVLRLIHDYITYPRIVRGGIHLHPLAIILSVLAGEQVAGIPGVFLSIPIVAIITVLYKHALEHSGKRGLFAGWIESEKAPAEEDA